MLLMTPDPRAPIPHAPRCAVLTPSGRGAIATVAVRGPGALAAVSRRFRPARQQRLQDFGIGRAVFGRLEISSQAAEESVVGLVGPDEVEIHCHGGAAVVAAICEALVQEGCALVTPVQWAHEIEADPIAAEALLALAKAPTERSAAILLNQYHGALRNDLETIDRLLDQRETAAAAEAIEKLLARAERGLHLTQPWRVVLCGAPNVGKSSLVNAILGYQRSIVWQEPGTT